MSIVGGNGHINLFYYMPADKGLYSLLNISQHK